MNIHTSKTKIKRFSFLQCKYKKKGILIAEIISTYIIPWQAITHATACLKEKYDSNFEKLKKVICVSRPFIQVRTDIWLMKSQQYFGIFCVYFCFCCKVTFQQQFKCVKPCALSNLY